MKTKIVVASLCLVAALAVFAAEKKMWAKSFIGQKAPKLEVEKWLTAEPDTKGKFVLVDFWATWCPPCRKAIPELNALHKKFGDKLVVIGISDETEAKYLEGMKLGKIQIDYSCALDTQARMKKAMEVKGIPHVVIMDPEGVVRWEGFPLLTGHELTEKVVEEIVNAPAAKSAAEPKKEEPKKDSEPKKPEVKADGK